MEHFDLPFTKPRGNWTITASIELPHLSRLQSFANEDSTFITLLARSLPDEIYIISVYIAYAICVQSRQGDAPHAANSSSHFILLVHDEYCVTPVTVATGLLTNIIAARPA